MYSNPSLALIKLFTLTAGCLTIGCGGCFLNDDYLLYDDETATTTTTTTIITTQPTTTEEAEYRSTPPPGSAVMGITRLLEPPKPVLRGKSVGFGNFAVYRGNNNVRTQTRKQSASSERNMPIQFMQCGSVPRFPEGVEPTSGYARRSEIPWLVRITVNINNGTGPRSIAKCEGALITRQHVLTTASCSNFRNATIIVSLGNPNNDVTDMNEFFIEVKTVNRHHLFSEVTKAFDVAVLTLKEEAVEAEAIMPICLPSSCNEFSELAFDNPCFASGWVSVMSSSQPDRILSPTLRKTVINTALQPDKCQSTIKQAANEGNSWSRAALDATLCAEKSDLTSYDIRNQAQVDVGGPLFCQSSDGNYTLEGILVSRSNYNSIDNVNVYIRPCKISVWINTILTPAEFLWEDGMKALTEVPKTSKRPWFL